MLDQVEFLTERYLVISSVSGDVVSFVEMANVSDVEGKISEDVFILFIDVVERISFAERFQIL